MSPVTAAPLSPLAALSGPCDGVPLPPLATVLTAAGADLTTPRPHGTASPLTNHSNIHSNGSANSNGSNIANDNNISNLIALGPRALLPAVTAAGQALPVMPPLGPAPALAPAAAAAAAADASRVITGTRPLSAAAATAMMEALRVDTAYAPAAARSPAPLFACFTAQRPPATAAVRAAVTAEPQTVRVALPAPANAFVAFNAGAPGANGASAAAAATSTAAVATNVSANGGVTMVKPAHVFSFVSVPTPLALHTPLLALLLAALPPLSPAAFALLTAAANRGSNAADAAAATVAAAAASYGHMFPASSSAVVSSSGSSSSSSSSHSTVTVTAAATLSRLLWACIAPSLITVPRPLSLPAVVPDLHALAAAMLPPHLQSHVHTHLHANALTHAASTSAATAAASAAASATAAAAAALGLSVRGIGVGTDGASSPAALSPAALWTVLYMAASNRRFWRHFNAYNHAYPRCVPYALFADARGAPLLAAGSKNNSKSSGTGDGADTVDSASVCVVQSDPPAQHYGYPVEPMGPHLLPRPYAPHLAAPQPLPAFLPQLLGVPASPTDSAVAAEAAAARALATAVPATSAHLLLLAAVTATRTTAVQSLHLTSNSLRAAHAPAVATLVRASPGVSHLGIASNRIDAAALAALLPTLARYAGQPARGAVGFAPRVLAAPRNRSHDYALLSRRHHATAAAATALAQAHAGPGGRVAAAATAAVAAVAAGLPSTLGVPGHRGYCGGAASGALWLRGAAAAGAAGESPLLSAVAAWLSSRARAVEMDALKSLQYTALALRREAAGDDDAAALAAACAAAGVVLPASPQALASSLESTATLGDDTLPLFLPSPYSAGAAFSATSAATALGTHTGTVAAQHAYLTSRAHLSHLLTRMSSPAQSPSSHGHGHSYSYNSHSPNTASAGPAVASLAPALAAAASAHAGAVDHDWARTLPTNPALAAALANANSPRNQNATATMTATASGGTCVAHAALRLSQAQPVFPVCAGFSGAAGLPRAHFPAVPPMSVTRDRAAWLVLAAAHADAERTLQFAALSHHSNGGGALPVSLDCADCVAAVAAAGAASAPATSAAVTTARNASGFALTAAERSPVVGLLASLRAVAAASSRAVAAVPLPLVPTSTLALTFFNARPLGALQPRLWPLTSFPLSAYPAPVALPLPLPLPAFVPCYYPFPHPVTASTKAAATAEKKSAHSEYFAPLLATTALVVRAERLPAVQSEPLVPARADPVAARQFDRSGYGVRSYEIQLSFLSLFR